MTTQPKRRDHVADILRKIHGWLSWVRKILREITVMMAMLGLRSHTEFDN